jgi:hypothetical protein
MRPLATRHASQASLIGVRRASHASAEGVDCLVYETLYSLVNELNSCEACDRALSLTRPHTQ